MNYNQSYMNQGFNPYIYTQMPRMQTMQQPMQQIENQYPQNQPIFKQALGLQGKSVDSIDVVKAMDIPLDGSISYFPLTDGTAIISKQLQMDGTSKTIVYKPVVDTEENKVIPQYITSDELNAQMKIIGEDNNTLKDGMNNIKDQIEGLSNDFKSLLNEVKSLKGGKK